MRMDSREVIRRLVQDGWYLHHVEGSHHWFAHADRTNRVTVEHPRRDIPIGTLRSNFSAGWMGLEDCERRMKYAIVVHKDPGSSYGVTVPGLPGCFSGGDTLDEAFANAREAIVCHIEGCLLEDQPIPKEHPLEEYQSNPDDADGMSGFVDVGLSGSSGASLGKPV